MNWGGRMSDLPEKLKQVANGAYDQMPWSGTRDPSRLL